METTKHTVFNLVANNIKENLNYGFHDDWCCSHNVLKGKANSLTRSLREFRKKCIRLSGDCKVTFGNDKKEYISDFITIESPCGLSKMYITPKYKLVDGDMNVKNETFFHVVIDSEYGCVQLFGDDIDDFTEKFKDRIDIYGDYIVDFVGK